METARAIRCFKENIELMPKDIAGNPLDKQAWNLNQGLLSLARAIAQIERDLQQAKNDIRHLR